MTRCVTDYLVQEHQELSLLLNELQEQLGVLRLARDRRKTAERLTGLRREISEALHSHVTEEEQILYPALEEHVQGIAFTLERMRHEHDAGEQTEKTFHQCLDRLVKGGGNPQEVMQSGRKYIFWLRHHLLDENGRLFPMVERGLDPETQQAARRAMEELSQESSARVAEGQTHTAQA
ncbi:MAG TPA: hemerythrin domain-containing protein [Terriglobia bacterium]|nr:hemerythrin domain-containing protein [Terriglobia bacterium]